MIARFPKKNLSEKSVSHEECLPSFSSFLLWRYQIVKKVVFFANPAARVSSISERLIGRNRRLKKIFPEKPPSSSFPKGPLLEKQTSHENRFPRTQVPGTQLSKQDRYQKARCQNNHFLGVQHFETELVRTSSFEEEPLPRCQVSKQTSSFEVVLEDQFWQTNYSRRQLSEKLASTKIASKFPGFPQVIETRIKKYIINQSTVTLRTLSLTCGRYMVKIKDG